MSVWCQQSCSLNYTGYVLKLYASKHLEWGNSGQMWSQVCVEIMKLNIILNMLVQSHMYLYKCLVLLLVPPVQVGKLGNKCSPLLSISCSSLCFIPFDIGVPQVFLESFVPCRCWSPLPSFFLEWYPSNCSRVMMVVRQAKDRPSQPHSTFCYNILQPLQTSSTQDKCNQQVNTFIYVSFSCTEVLQY